MFRIFESLHIILCFAYIVLTISETASVSKTTSIMLNKPKFGGHLAMRPGRKAASPKPLVFSQCSVVCLLYPLNHHYYLAPVWAFFYKFRSMMWGCAPAEQEDVFAVRSSRYALLTLKRES